MRTCEIIYNIAAKGWKWRLPAPRENAAPTDSKQTFPLFYDCVAAARAKGLRPNVRCP